MDMDMYNEVIVTDTLTELLDGLLEYGNQENSFKVIKTDMDRMKMTVEFDIVIDENEGYVGFQGY